MAIVIASLTAIGISASCVNGYSTYSIGVDDAFWPWAKDEAYATLERCSCTPVDNQLMVWIQAQYKEDGVYKWTPSESDYYFSKETNVDKVERTIKEDDITYVHALYFAICGDNPEYSFEDTYRND